MSRKQARDHGLATLAHHVWPDGANSDAGIELTLVRTLGQRFPGWGEDITTILVATIMMNQIAGPALFKRVLTEGEAPPGSSRPVTRWCYFTSLATDATAKPPPFAAAAVGEHHVTSPILGRSRKLRDSGHVSATEDAEGDDSLEAGGGAGQDP